jgi:hypothetical protein
MAGPQNAVPDLQQLQAFSVNRTGQVEVIRQSLYDFTTYPLAGQTSLTFFQIPIGQAGKTKFDTNMEVAGSLPNPKKFLVKSIEVHLYPGGSPETGSIANDTYTFSQNGFLDFFIGSKSYLTEAPLGRLPQSVGMRSVAFGAQAGADYAVMGGQSYVLTTPIVLEPTQNFNVSLNWPVAVPLSANARVGIVLNGLLYRLSQ